MRDLSDEQRELLHESSRRLTAGLFGLLWLMVLIVGLALVYFQLTVPA